MPAVARNRSVPNIVVSDADCDRLTDLATASLDGFTEDDPQGTGAALEVHDSDADSVASVLGVRFDADMAMGSGVFTPVVSVSKAMKPSSIQVLMRALSVG